MVHILGPLFWIPPDSHGNRGRIQNSISNPSWSLRIQSYALWGIGVTGGPATFQSNFILATFLRKCVVVFIDDILIYSKTWTEHLHHIKEVLTLLQKHRFHVKQQLTYLGHIVSIEGVSTDPSKIKTVQEWPQPQNVKDLRSFLGMVGYYRKFVPHFGIVSKPLTDLLKKNTIFVWTPATKASFQTLKKALLTAPVLAMPNFDEPFTIETDASAKGIGVILPQQGHPIAYVSKALGVKAQGLSTYEKEYLAIIMAVDHWRHYLQTSPFVILTDQKSLTHLKDQKLSTPWQHKAPTKLMGLTYKIIYKKGVDNKVADALSRVPQSDTYEISAIYVVKPVWLQDIQAGYQQDSHALQLLTELSVQSASGHYTLKEGIIRYKGRIWVGSNFSLQAKILASLQCCWRSSKL